MLVIEKQNEESKIFDILNVNTARIGFRYNDSDTYTLHKNFTYMELFFLIAPELMVEASVKRMANMMAVVLNPDKANPKKILMNHWPIASNATRNLLADFRVLDLIFPSPKKHQVKDVEEYWCLSEKGIKVYNQIRISKLEAGLAKSEDSHILPNF